MARPKRKGKVLGCGFYYERTEVEFMIGINFYISVGRAARAKF
jgi:hypothetical protein